MDEEKNNGQDPAQKASKDIQDAVNAVKDGAKLAKDVSTGNVLGIIKNGLKLLKNKKVRKMMIISTLLPIITTMLFASAILVIFDAVGNVIQTVVDAIKSLFKINSNSWDGTIEITDDQVDQTIQCIKDLGIKLEDLRLSGEIDRDANDTKEEREEKETKAARIYVKKFLEAQFVTETPHYEPKTKNGATYGRVYLYRTNNADVIDENTQLDELEWISYEKMQKAVEKKDTDTLQNSYSVDEEGKLVIPQWTKKNTKVDGKAKDVEITAVLRHIDYKNVISQYTTPTNFLIYLTMVSENPEFVRAVTELIKQNTKIDIVVLDKVTTTVNTEVNGQTKNQKTTSNPPKRHGEAAGKPETTTADPIKEKTETITTTTVIDPMLKVTYAKTWFSEQRVTYNLTQQDPYNNSQKYDKNNSEDLKDDPEPAKPPKGESRTWYTDKYITIDTNVTGTVYKEGTRGTVKYLGGEKGDQGVTPDSYKDATKREVKMNFDIDENSTFVGLMDDFFKIPNSEEFEAAGITNLNSGAELLFGLLQKDSALQGLEKVMRYVIQKYTGRDYGVKEIDFEILDTRNFVTVSAKGGALEEILRSHENNALRIYMNGEIELYGGVQKYVTQDKKYYKMFYTSFDNCLNFSYGVMVRNSKGKLNNEQLFAEEGLNLQELVDAYARGDEVLVEVEKIDRIFSKIVSQKKEEVKKVFEKQGVELKENEIDALVCVSFQYGNFGQYNNIVNLYKNYYENGSNIQAFRNNAQAQVGGGGTDHIFTDETSRKIANWRLFSEGKYILPDGTEIKSGGLEGMTDLQQRVVEVAKNSAAYGCIQTANMCQAWVYQVYYAAGACAKGTSRHCAMHAAWEWSVSTDLSQIPIGATVYGYSTTIHGHVGIYIGDGIVAHNVGGIAFTDLDAWIKQYNGVCWGWNGVDLTGGSYPCVGGLVTKPTHPVTE